MNSIHPINHDILEGTDCTGTRICPIHRHTYFQPRVPNAREKKILTYVAEHLELSYKEIAKNLGLATHTLCRICRIHHLVKPVSNLLLPKNCVRCGMLFQPSHARIKFCSKSCANIAHRLNPDHTTNDKSAWAKACAHKRYLARTPEQKRRALETTVAWQKAHPEKVREYSRRYQKKITAETVI